MSDFLIRYSSDITPTETVTLDDGTEKTFFHSIIDGRFGGRAEKSVGQDASNIGAGTYFLNSPTASTLNTIASGTLPSVSLLYVEILSIPDDDDVTGPPRCSIYMGTTRIAELGDVGDWVLLRPDQVSGSNLKLVSGGGPNACTIRFVYALF